MIFVYAPINHEPTMKIHLLLGCFVPCLVMAQLNLEKPFRECEVQGSITLYDRASDTWTFSNEEDSKVPSNPASTFKILNSLIALEEGILKDEYEVMKFVGVSAVDTARYGNRTDIFKDMDMQEAFRTSAVWFYLEIAKEVGREKYRQYLTACAWGNMNFTEPGLDFWNFGPFVVSPVQQIELLKKLYDGSLPFSKRNIDIVKKIMIAETTPGYTLRGKTGWGTSATEDLGWWVGYVEKNETVCFFATRIRKMLTTPNPRFVSCRKSITADVLNQLKITEK